MTRPTAMQIARAFAASRRMSDRECTRLAFLAARVLGWFDPSAPPRHVLAVMLAEVLDLPALHDDARAAAVTIVAAAFYPCP